MNIQVLPLRVLVSRQVIRDRMDYTNYLAGKTKSEMNILDRLTGRFEDVQHSKLTVERYFGGGEVPKNEWAELDKWQMPDSLFDIFLGRADISIVETSSSGPRAWVISDVDGLKKRFPLKSKGYMIGPKHWRHTDFFIEDGTLIVKSQVFVMEGAKGDQGGPMWANVDQGLIMETLESFSTDKKGNLVRKIICSMPIPDIKITKVISATRVVGSDGFLNNVKKTTL